MNLQSKMFRPGEFIFRENDRSRELYIIRKGNIKVCRVVSGREVELAVLGKGSVLGEMALIDGRARSASAKTLDDCQVTIIDAETFHERVRGVPPWFMTLIKMTCQKIRNANRLMQNIGRGSHGINIILALEYLFAKQGESLELSETRRQLSWLLGASEQNVGRICEFLHRNQIVHYSDSAIRLSDKKLIADYCEFLRLHIRKFYTRTAPPTLEARSAIMALQERAAGAASGAEAPTKIADITGEDFREFVGSLHIDKPPGEVMAALEGMGILKSIHTENRDEKADPLSGATIQVCAQRLRQWYLYFFFCDMVPCL